MAAASPVQGDADRERFRSLIAVSRETEERLSTYIQILRRWQTITNLISKQTLDDVWARHVADSAQLVDLNPQAARWVDIGSGAGFPGLVIAIRLIGVKDAMVHCIESDRRKCAFLREVVRATGAPAQIHAQRAETVRTGDTQGVQAVTARAFAPLASTLRLAGPWLAQGATGLFQRGKSARKELESLPSVQDYSVKLSPSVVDCESTIIVMRQKPHEL